MRDELRLEATEAYEIGAEIARRNGGPASGVRDHVNEYTRWHGIVEAIGYDAAIREAVRGHEEMDDDL